MPTRDSVREWWRLCASGPVVRRALVYAVVVGAILITINHGDALGRGDIDPPRLLRMALTVWVPYTVSTLSSVSVMRSLEIHALRGSVPDEVKR